MRCAVSVAGATFWMVLSYLANHSVGTSALEGRADMVLYLEVTRLLLLWRD